MSKGLRLSFCGTTCTAHEIKVMAHALGYETMPVFYGWGKRGGYRNFLALTLAMNPNIQIVLRASLLLKKRLMWVENATVFSESVFHLTKKVRIGLAVFEEIILMQTLRNKRNKKNADGCMKQQTTTQPKNFLRRSVRKHTRRPHPEANL
jgi:hypothetical protein